MNRHERRAQHAAARRSGVVSCTGCKTGLLPNAERYHPVMQIEATDKYFDAILFGVVVCGSCKRLRPPAIQAAINAFLEAFDRETPHPWTDAESGYIDCTAAAKLKLAPHDGWPPSDEAGLYPPGTLNKIKKRREFTWTTDGPTELSAAVLDQVSKTKEPSSEAPVVCELREEHLTATLALEQSDFRLWLTTDFAISVKRVDDLYLAKLHVRGRPTDSTAEPLPLAALVQDVNLYLAQRDLLGPAPKREHEC